MIMMLHSIFNHSSWLVRCRSAVFGKTLRRVLGSLFALALVTEPAAAQRTGSRIGATAQPGNPEHARLAADLLARCIATRRPDLVERWMRLLPGSAEETATVRRERNDLSACLDDDRLVMDGRELAFNARQMRPRVALAVAKRVVGSAPQNSPLAPTAEPWFMPQLNALPPGAAVDRTALGVQDFGHCVVVNAWGPARALLAAEPGSPAEGTALAAIRPALGPCLSEGVQIELTPFSLRGFLAEPFLHAVRAPRPHSASSR